MNQSRSNPLKSAEFLISAARPAQFPADELPEVAFAGRSNAGKSSALNRLTEQKNLARISKTPGRTQLINFFQLTGGQRLVDLPGYGYAKVPPAVKEKWARLIESYLQKRGNLVGLIHIMDVRHPMKPFDEQMLEFANAIDCPVHILLTKADKLKRGQQAKQRQIVRNAIGESASVQLFSAESGQGTEEARAVVAGWLGLGAASAD
ncbi:ribosome biogenesis GTP-binding protein YihA/YsxC [Natronospira bacteriovora]|uniref:Probable GTP-binding protein EngB n=1 Tax=Natronospira bacteriovora TaxID=3069753 RepID=A0ABU0W701_9GAMM|nr:ribosome biogenesis GTP-binding protein YihA/YsxC [Natronospira sp. AB-CW4]MDQ2069806.1 ribosome biogenesis GTP-binding protein YihA/YsxC [Natronospira sp. AB-CW4]